MLTVDDTELKAALLAHHGLLTDRPESGDAAVRAVLHDLGMIQLDPLEPIGTNADLVLAARTAGTTRGQVYDALLPGHAFEHFAKERCLLPAAAFPAWRDHALQAPWWRLSQRLKRVDQGLIDAVHAEVAARGPLTAADLSDHGRVKPVDWSGWKGTAKAGTMALEVLWTRCRIVVAGRRGSHKLYDLPERALGEHATAPAPADPQRWQLVQRVRAMGAMPTAVGPWWSGLRTLRDTRLPAILEAGDLVEIGLHGSRRRWLIPADLLHRPRPEPDERLRILGPLDPLLWDRWLVQRLFGFRYVWEVYKPAAKREWGWYVCPLLHRGALVGRLEARVRDGALVVDRLWQEPEVDPAALARALARHADFLGVALP